IDWEANLVYFEDATGLDYGVRMADFDGDGWVDMIQGTMGNYNMRLNDHAAFFGSGGPGPLNSTYDIATSTGQDQGVRFFDANGDGRVDMVKGDQCFLAYCKVSLINDG